MRRLLQGLLLLLSCLVLAACVRRGGRSLRDRLAQAFAPLTARFRPDRGLALSGRAGRGG